MSLLFSVPECTCCTTVHQLAEAFTKYMVPKCIRWPTEQERINIARYVEDKMGFPGVMGFIDGCHIPVKRPAHSGDQYYNRKQFTSIILQGLPCKYPSNCDDISQISFHMQKRSSTGLYVFRCVPGGQKFH